MARRCVALLFAALLVTIPVAAQTLPLGASASSVAAVQPVAVTPLQTAFLIPAPARPPVLPWMYVSLAALQGYDAYSTMTAMKQGATESNPLMAGVAGHPAGLLIVKSVTTVATIWVSERLWRKHHRGAAIALMVATNGMMAFVASRNASVLRAQR
jgi:hypothetical protein